MKAFARVFAREFESSDLVLGASEGTSGELVTCTGAQCSKMYIAGALLELGAVPDGDLYARVADPTGAFELRIRRTQRDLVEVLSHMQPPVFVSAIADVVVRTDARDADRRILALEEIRATDRAARDCWIVKTASATCDRLEMILCGLEGKDVPERFMMAIRHYGTSREKVAELAEMIGSALENVSDTGGEEIVGGEPWEIVLNIIRDKGGRDGIHMQDIISNAILYGLSEGAVEEAVRVLLQEDECYQPSRDVIKIL